MLIRSVSKDDIKPGTVILWVGEPLPTYWKTLTVLKNFKINATDTIDYCMCIKTFTDGSFRYDIFQSVTMESILISKFCKIL